MSSLAAAKGAGLCLIDYGRAVDTRAFHEDTMFIGSCETEDFQCVQMLERKPWKWQVCVCVCVCVGGGGGGECVCVCVHKIILSRSGGLFRHCCHVSCSDVWRVHEDH